MIPLAASDGYDTDTMNKLTVVAFALGVCVFASVARGDEPAEQAAPRAIQGRVVFMGEAVRRLHKVETLSEAEQNVLAIETFEGELHPLVEQIRARAFRRDERLRKIDVELLVRDVPRSPMLEVIGVRKLDRDAKKKFELDYWCEICAIAMYELKACECCQGPIELRLREIPSADEPR
jgi:hypothetical protein